jgi:hypothetical protein
VKGSRIQMVLLYTTMVESGVFNHIRFYRSQGIHNLFFPSMPQRLRP